VKIQLRSRPPKKNLFFNAWSKVSPPNSLHIYPRWSYLRNKFNLRKNIVAAAVSIMVLFCVEQHMLSSKQRSKERIIKSIKTEIGVSLRLSEPHDEFLLLDANARNETKFFVLI